LLRARLASPERRASLQGADLLAGLLADLLADPELITDLRV
tara:strand:- start:831 stop:953 length:123 start_codon:yes stop_codon:yes gene_type:complete